MARAGGTGHRAAAAPPALRAGGARRAAGAGTVCADLSVEPVGSERTHRRAACRAGQQRPGPTTVASRSAWASRCSRRCCASICSTGRVFDDREAARQAVRRGELSFAVLIPGDFSEQALPGWEVGAARLTLYNPRATATAPPVLLSAFAPGAGASGQRSRSTSSALGAGAGDRVPVSRFDGDAARARRADPRRQRPAGRGPSRQADLGDAQRARSGPGRRRRRQQPHHGAAGIEDADGRQVASGLATGWWLAGALRIARRAVRRPPIWSAAPGQPASDPGTEELGRAWRGCWAATTYAAPGRAAAATGQRADPAGRRRTGRAARASGRRCRSEARHRPGHLNPQTSQQPQAGSQLAAGGRTLTGGVAQAGGALHQIVAALPEDGRIDALGQGAQQLGAGTQALGGKPRSSSRRPGPPNTA